MRLHPYFTHHIRKKKPAKTSAFYVLKSAHPLFTDGLKGLRNTTPTSFHRANEKQNQHDSTRTHSFAIPYMKCSSAADDDKFRVVYKMNLIT